MISKEKEKNAVICSKSLKVIAYKYERNSPSGGRSRSKKMSGIPPLRVDPAQKKMSGITRFSRRHIEV